MVVKDMQPTNVNYPVQVPCDALSAGSSLPVSETLPTSFITRTLDDKANSSHVLVDEAEPKLSKKQQRKLRKQQRALISDNAKDTIATVIDPEFSSKLVTTPSSIPPIVDSNLPPQQLSHNGAGTHTINTSMARSAGQTTPVAPPPTTAGLLATTGRYHAIAGLNDLAPSALFNVIGVVVQVSPPGITRTGDWYCNIHLVDPSNTKIEDLNGFEGFRVNCFTRKYAQWLPHPSPGEVLIMRDLKISNYHGFMGVGYYNKLQWAIFSPSTGKIRHCDLGDAPESEGLQEDFGYSFTPFFKPEEAEIRYCLKMADWWAEIEKKRISIGDVHQVLHGHLNDNGVYSLYVTDYTANTGVSPISASWCPRSLSDYVLKIEVWDDAVEMAQTMFAGEFYSIKNARMMISRANYVEGKVVQKKIQQLDVQIDGDVNTYFKALLERVITIFILATTLTCVLGGRRFGKMLIRTRIRLIFVITK
ncbi:hypothetical protein C0992_010004 [Termitomyces sp. T32_za158]|nr:hypothetical protein C0992_010004 [Termitomyces sp. T32_za158]